MAGLNLHLYLSIKSTAHEQYLTLMSLMGRNYVTGPERFVWPFQLIELLFAEASSVVVSMEKWLSS